MQNNIPRPQKFQKEVSYVKLFRLLLSRWHWIVGILIIGIVAGYVYLLLTPPLYATTASLKFEEKKSELSELINVRNLYDRTNKVESEKMIIRSRNVLIKAIRSLNCETTIFIKKDFRKIDIYPSRPIVIKVYRNVFSKYLHDHIEFRGLSFTGYQLCYNIDDQRVCKNYKYGQIVNLPGLIFKIAVPPANTVSRTRSYLIKFNTEAEILERIGSSLKLDDTQNVNILNLKFTDHNPYFATDLLNAILFQYLEFDKMQRSISVSQTSDFINSLLNTISDTLSASGQALQKYKEHNEMLSVSSRSMKLADRLTKLETEKHTLDIQNMLLASLEKDMGNEHYFEKLNYNLQGITDIQLNGITSKYNELLISKKIALNTYTSNSRVVIQINDQLADLKSAIIDNVITRIKSNNETCAFLGRQIDSVYNAQNSIPKTERNFIILQSKFEIDQKIHAYLEEKKLEAQISKAAVISGAFVIDKANFPAKPILPIAKNTYLTFALASLLFGLTLIFVVRILNPYIHHKEAIEELSSIPVIGIINSYKGIENEPNNQIKILKDSRSPFSESLRSVRSNLSFLASEKDSKVICITSEVSGEGKSFVSINLACTLTLINKSVLLIAADLRKSKLHLSLNTGYQNGLSKYLSGQANSEEILIKTDIDNLDFISSGPVPPNPSELLHSQKMKDLINNLREKYDFILIDCAPIGLVTDAKPLIKMSDINLFILRSGISRLEFAATPERLQKEFNLTDIAIILNDFKDNSFQRSYTTGGNRNNSYDKNYYYSNQTNYAQYKDYLEL